MNESISHLLTQVGLIAHKYDELATLTGERFNIFSIMSMENNEVYTHSAFLGELLHANGSHDLKDKPLRLFLDTLNEQFIPNDDNQLFKFDTKESWSVMEEYQGVISIDAISGGRIDIVIKNKQGQVILIENKIYAGEQSNQLQRYNKSYPKAPILFLTLNGHQPNSGGVLKENEIYFCISYEKTIVAWLEKCLKEAVALPMLREVIRQYIFLIKKLTNQTNNSKMSQEISEVLSKNIEASFTVFANEIALKGKLVKTTEQELEKYAESNHIKFVSDYSDDAKETGFYFIPEGWDNRIEKICFRFEHLNYNDFYGGITNLIYPNDEHTDRLIRAFQVQGDYKVSVSNIWRYIYRGKGDVEIWKSFANGDMAKRIIIGLKQIIKIDTNS